MYHLWFYLFFNYGEYIITFILIVRSAGDSTSFLGMPQRKVGVSMRISISGTKGIWNV